MASMDKLEALVEAHVRRLMNQACTELAQAYAGAIATTAPVDTGQLAGTVSAEGNKVSLQHYWAFVAYGHRIYSRRDQGYKVKRVDANGATIYAYTKPNDFMEKAWASPQVQKVLQKYSRKFVTIPYPLKKVNMQIQDQ